MKLSLKLKKKSPMPRLMLRLLKRSSINTMKISQRIVMILMQMRERLSKIPLRTNKPLLTDTTLLSKPPKKLLMLTQLPVDILV